MQQELKYLEKQGRAPEQTALTASKSMLEDSEELTNEIPPRSFFRKVICGGFLLSLRKSIGSLAV